MNNSSGNCKIRYAQRNEYSCHVAPLPINMKEVELLKIFAEYDDLSGVFIASGKETDKYTFGFVRFKSRKSADHAVRYLKKKVDGKYLRVNHAKQSKAFNDSKFEKTVPDKFFINVFKENSRKFLDLIKDFDSMLKKIHNEKVPVFEYQQPTLSVDLSKTITKNIDQKNLDKFIQEQNNISKSLSEICGNLELRDTLNRDRHSSQQSESSLKEKESKKEELDSNKEINRFKTCQSEVEDEGLGNFSCPDQECSDISKSNDKHKDIKPSRCCSQELSSESGKNTEYSSEEKESRTCRLMAQKRLEKIWFHTKHYPMGRGMGLSLVDKKNCSSNQPLPSYEDNLVSNLVKHKSPRMADLRNTVSQKILFSKSSISNL